MLGQHRQADGESAREPPGRSPGLCFCGDKSPFRGRVHSIIIPSQAVPCRARRRGSWNTPAADGTWRFHLPGRLCPCAIIGLRINMIFSRIPTLRSRGESGDRKNYPLKGRRVVDFLPRLAQGRGRASDRSEPDTVPGERLSPAAAATTARTGLMSIGPQLGFGCAAAGTDALGSLGHTPGSGR